MDCFLGRGFSSKCKSSIKMIRSRIDVISRKKNATVKIMKKDVADLLANGLDINAYGRAEGLITELNLSSCYDMIDQFCGCILKQLSCMQKKRDCPPESREAVSSLIFAAARFADLPELRKLRSIFTERYGDSLESFVNQEFVQRIASDPPLVDKKLHLMRSISQEFFIKWDSKAFEWKISNSSPSTFPQSKKCVSLSSNDDRSLRKPLSGRDNAAIEMGSKEISSNERQEPTPTPWHTTRQWVKTDHKEIHIVTSTNDGFPPSLLDSTEKVSMEEAERVKWRYTNNMIPPYVKPKDNKSIPNSEAQYGEPVVPPVYDMGGSNNRSHSAPCRGSDRSSHKRQVVGQHDEPVNPMVYDTGIPNNRSERSSIGSKRQVVGHGTSNNGFGDDKDYENYLDNSVSDANLKSRSSRKKHPKAPAVHENDGATNGNKLASRNQNGRRRHGVRRKVPISNFVNDHDDSNDEEKIMDRLLIHYSKKPSACEASQLNKGLKALIPHVAGADKSPPILNESGAYSNLGSGVPPRSVSLPVQQTSRTEVSRRPVRAASLQPDILNSNGRNVHPKLPDYDDLTAQFAAYRGA